MDMKKILLLGGSDAQLIAIDKAKELGYYTIVCDYLPDNPGQYRADKFYLASTTDKHKILEIAKEERIDGILAYSSDPAAPTAAYVARELGLPGMDYDKVRAFCEKQLFREFLAENGFNVPSSKKIQLPFNTQEIKSLDLDFPVVVKPTDSSGSKGITVIKEECGLSGALAYASRYSRNKTLLIEEFIQRDHPHVIEAELFVIDGKVESWGLMNSIRDKVSNPLLPAGYSYPLDLPAQRKAIVKNEIERLIKAFGNPSGAFNIEMIIDRSDRLFFLDAGPRNGGNRLPEFLSMISRKDMVAATIECAMGRKDHVDVSLDGESGGYWSLAVLHTAEDGVFAGTEYSPEAQKALVKEHLQKNVGDPVSKFSRCDDLAGLSFFHFSDEESMKDVMYDMNRALKVKLK